MCETALLMGLNGQVKVGDYDELRIPQEAHRISTGRSASSENLDQVD